LKIGFAAILCLALLGAPAMALDPDACNAAVKQIDERIAAGDHPQQNVAIAGQLREGIMQSCGYLDETTLAQMLAGLDQLLPSEDGASVAPQQSAAEREAEREAQRAEADRRQAERKKRRAAKRAREEAELKLVSDAVRQAPTARSTASRVMNRPDRMWGASIVDWDVHESKGRLLYETWPSREQARNADAARHYYVVEFDRNDNVEQHHVLETNLARTVTAGLIRGRDEIVVQWHEGGTRAEESFLERWSISNSRMLARTPAPRMQSPRGELGAHQHFALVTAGGELLYTGPVALGTGPLARQGLSWMLSSPDGEVRDQGFIEHDNETVAASGWFHSADAGAGLILDIRTDRESGIDSQLQLDAVRFGDAEARAVVSSERRLYVAGGTNTGATLPAFERRHIWLGLENVDQSMMISGESTRLVQEAESEHRLNDTTVSLAVAGRHRTAVAPSRGGHALLITSNQRDDAFPPTRGQWLQEFATGQPRRDTYLNPDAAHLGVKFNMLASDGGESLYVGSRQCVLLLNGAREVSAYARSDTTDSEIKAMIAEGNSVWLFGENSGGGDAQRQVWVERLQF
jgi:hypothetical protein